MSNFKVGDRVRCVDTTLHNSFLFYNPLVKGKEYIITNITTCTRCNAIHLQVGVITKYNGTAHCNCGISEKFMIGEDAKFGAYRFEKVLEKTEYIAVTVDVKIEEPVLN